MKAPERPPITRHPVSEHPLLDQPKSEQPKSAPPKSDQPKPAQPMRKASKDDEITTLNKMMDFLKVCSNSNIRMRKPTVSGVFDSFILPSFIRSHSEFRSNYKRIFERSNYRKFKNFCSKV